MVCDQTATSTKGFVVSNSLPYCDYKIEEIHNNTIDDVHQHTDNNRILLLLILSHILMSKSSVTEGMWV